MSSGNYIKSFRIGNVVVPSTAINHMVGTDKTFEEVTVYLHGGRMFILNKDRYGQLIRELGLFFGVQEMIGRD